jgi:hypothetical protein
MPLSAHCRPSPSKNAARCANRRFGEATPERRQGGLVTTCSAALGHYFNTGMTNRYETYTAGIGVTSRFSLPTRS